MLLLSSHGMPREHSEVKALEQERTWVASSLQCTSGVLVWQITNCDQSSPMLKQQLTELRIQQWLKTTTATSIAHAFFHWPPKQVSLHSAPNTLLSAGFEIDSPWNPGIVRWSCWNAVYPMEHDFLLYRDIVVGGAQEDWPAHSTGWRPKNSRLFLLIFFFKENNSSTPLVLL